MPKTAVGRLGLGGGLAPFLNKTLCLACWGGAFGRVAVQRSHEVPPLRSGFFGGEDSECVEKQGRTTMLRRFVLAPARR